MTVSDDIRVWELLVRFHRRTTSVMDASLQEGFGHSLDDYDVLHQLKTAGRPLRMTDLARRLLVANSSCNRIVGRLVDEGLVERSTGETDRREVLVDLTAAGRRVHRRLAARHTRDIQRHVSNRLTAEERRVVLSVFERLLSTETEPQRDAGGRATSASR